MPPKSYNAHYDTPQKAKFQGAYQFLLSKGIPVDPKDIFKEFGVEARSGYRMIERGVSSQTRHHSDLNETRGRKSK